MNFFDSMRTSASGLTAQRLRMNLVSNNLANANTTRTAQGGPYQRQEPVFSAIPVKNAFGEILKGELGANLSDVNVTEIINDQRKPLLKYDPMHPDADQQGFVSMPNVNVMEEMVNMMTASRSYEANVTAISTSKNMVQKALEIGR
ncbi:MAG: flagellar basal body rod protein FlgC [Deltaproteobacteria bacterium]|jgi:flagellar basal-body rod protein FlgC